MKCEAKMVNRLGEEVVCLTAGGYEALLAPQLGCNCFDLTHLPTAAHLLRSPESVAQLREDPNVYGTPLLFPPNRIKDGTYTFNGRTYHLPINERHGHHMHGFISGTAFDVEALTADEFASRARFVFRSTKEKPYLPEFPHQFTIRVEACLSGEGLYQQVTFVNDGEDPMPLGTGFHTAMRAPFLPEGRAEDIRLTLTCGKAYYYDERIIPDGRTSETDPLLLALQGDGVTPCAAPISIHLSQTGGLATLRDVGAGRAIRYEVCPEYKFWMLWNMDAQHFFMCPEPQTWIIDAPNSPLPPEESGFQALEPGASKTFWTRLSLT